MQSCRKVNYYFKDIHFIIRLKYCYFYIVCDIDTLSEGPSAIVEFIIILLQTLKGTKKDLLLW